ncbi:hypothetical protein CICLE_v10021500mg [Citrus x clementina]|uniref:TIR domain-containing protein n=1 Tax=Citrus clementina TaxID=85681 RepID=V4TZU8_CITCL|nr:hypothetical protein CICLE_v10021500mg [Citrus x clementina]
MASTPSSSCKYDVFLSFRGEDTRCNFTSHLYAAFCQKKIKTYIDDEEISRGEKISPAISKAIQGSKVSIIIFSKDYASSDWCLNELVKILDCKKINGQIVIPVFYHVDPSDVRKQNGSFRDPFVEHEKQFKNMPEKIQKWRAALTEESNLSGWDSMTIRSEAQLVNKIVGDVLKKLKSSVKKNQHPFNQFSAFIQVILSYRFLLYSSFLQSVQSCKSRNWDEKSKQASFNKKEHDDESLSRDEVEMVIRKLTLFCSSEDEELPQKLGSAELSWLFEEKEPSLEEVRR